MALISGSTSAVLGSHRPRSLPRSSVAVRTLSQHVEQPVMTATHLTPSSRSCYAILQLGGVRQMVEEGHDYSCLSRLLQDARSNGTSNHAVFQSVLGIRRNGQFTWGKPFVPDAAVEVEVLEEFQGPVPHTSAAIPVDSVMARYRVKRIQTSSQAASIL